MMKTDVRFVLTTKEAISEFQQALRNINTDKSKNVWMPLFMKFYQLEQFIVEVRKSNGQEYKALSLYTGFCALVLYRTLDGRMKSLVNDSDKNHKQSSLLKIDEIKFILNSPAMAVDNPKDDNDMRLELPKEKNHGRRIKDPYTESGNSLILPNIPENIYIPVADIQKYLSKHPNNAKDDYVFVDINTPKKV
ncbi:zinc finger mym-type protein 2-like: PROVISIONAL [Gigaspora margarita]|uniref:Zinc finger mym-type protein 2-like: PROVISIONAL n=1 Tax=Gigaspora margarita TaxID=4874 RepID=A0A8H3WV32_GIGMA|nr:zinc finger mym-type protein 2-like: PROVISIONAL [Gigaspora margarita]